MKYSLILGFIMMHAASIHAGIKWENPTIERTLPDGFEMQQFEFKFTVDGEHPVHIDKIDTDCGCTTIRLDKNDYEPGDSGTITALLSPTKGAYLQEKHITVNASDQKASHRLVIKITKEDSVRPSTTKVEWGKADWESDKTISLTVAQGVELRLKPLSPAHSEILNTQIEDTLNSGEKLLKLIPAGSHRRASIPLIIQAVKGNKLESQVIIIVQLKD